MTCGASYLLEDAPHVFGANMNGVFTVVFNSEFFVVAQIFMALMMEETKPPCSVRLFDRYSARGCDAIDFDAGGSGG